MKKIFLFLIIFAIILLSAFLIIYLTDQKTKAVNESVLNSNISLYQTQTDSQASVDISVIPKTMGIDKEKNIFTVSLNTHSVDLSYDFKKIIILRDDLNNQYTATEWTGGGSGHHISGDIIFSRIKKGVKRLELQIKGIGGVDRLFKWEIK